MNPSPTLTIIAGCNGSGKSSYVNAITASRSDSFDYDKVFLEHYHSLPDSEIRDLMAHNLAWEALQQMFTQSICAHIYSKSV